MHHGKPCASHMDACCFVAGSDSHSPADADIVGAGVDAL